MLEAVSLLAQAASPQVPWWYNLAPMVFIGVVFYFLLFAPMRKRQKELQAMIDGLQKGDRVVTNGGLHGRVAALDGGEILLEVADQVKVKVSRSSVAQLVDKGGSS